MATVNKDFKIKSGLIVEGSTATVGGYDVLTKKQGDQDYIVGLIGGTATSANTANTVVKRDASGNFAAGTITANVTGQVSDISNHDTGDLSEGTNLYFTNQRALDATNAAYDAAGSAAYEAGLVAGDLSDHMSDTSAHGVTGNVVGTTDTQTLTNKTIGDTLNFTGAGAMTINSDSHIVLTPAAGSTVKWGSHVLATEYFVDGQIDAANDYTDAAISTEVTDRNSAIATAKAQAIQDSKDYTDAEVSALVDSAPALLDTLNELAAAIADNPNYATDAANAVAGRVAKAGDTMTGDLTLPGAPTLALHAATKDYVDGEITTALLTASGYANDVAEDLSDHETLSAGVHGVTGSVVGTTDSQDLSNKRFIDTTYFTDGVTIANEGQISVLSPSHEFEVKANYGPLGLKSYDDDIVLTPGSGKDVKWGADVLATQAYVDNQTTSDVEEGTNEYFTDARAKSSAADLLTGASLTNITITGTGAGLTITAENGVADSDTDDLTEGTTNLYFTEQRAVDALEAVVPNFTSVELNSVALQVAATTSAPTAGIQVAHGFLKADWRSAEYLVKVAYGTHTEISKVLLTLDTSDNIAITEYGIVGTNGSASSISAGVSGDTVQLQVTTANNNSTVTVVGTLLA